MITVRIDLSTLCADAEYTLMKILARMRWKHEPVIADGFRNLDISFPEQDEDMFEFICGEFI